MLVDMDSLMHQAFMAGWRDAAGGVAQIAAGLVPRTNAVGVLRTAANSGKERTDGRT